MSTQLSKHFTEEEFVCRGCGILHAPVHPAQLDLLERIREDCGRPLFITSGSRCPCRQKLLNEGDLSTRGADNSPHVPRICADGKFYTVASDIICFVRPSIALSPLDLQQINRNSVRRVDPKCRIGYRKYAGRNFLHLDVAYLVDRQYLLELGGPDNKMLRSWVAGVEW
jgi:hypothetical protein